MATEVREEPEFEAVNHARAGMIGISKAEKGLNEKVVNQISDIKQEPEWMRQFRLKSLAEFEAQQEKSWDDLPQEIKDPLEKLSIPELEKRFLAGVNAQSESEVVDGSLQQDLQDQGVIFTDTDTAVREHSDLLREYFGTIVPPTDNKFAALNGAIWSGGSFIYVPKDVHIEFPLQAYFRMDAESIGQFERTLIVVDEGASIHYVEGCTAAKYTTEILHSAVVEVVVKRNARCRYTTIQNWANNVYNLVTQRADAYGDAIMQWVDGNLGSKLTMKHPAVHMMEPGARGEILSFAFSGAGQNQDAGGKLVHWAPNTTGQIVSKSISKNGGRGSFRSLVRVEPGAHNSKDSVDCEALILDDQSRCDIYPDTEVLEQDVAIGHETNVSRISEEQMFYLLSRGLTKAEASTMIVNGFVEPLVRELPMEYAVEMNRLIRLQMEGSVE